MNAVLAMITALLALFQSGTLIMQAPFNVASCANIALPYTVPERPTTPEHHCGLASYGYGLAFDGIDDYAQAAYFDPRSADGTELSACMWVRWTGGPEQWLGLQLYTPARVFWLGTSADYPGRLRVVLSRDGGLTKHYVTTEVVFDGTWRHVGFSFGSGVLTVFIDGQPAAVSKLTDGAMTTINAAATSKYVLDTPPGEVAAIVICPRAMSQAEVQQCMVGGWPADARAIWCWQTTGSGQVLTDISGNGNDGWIGTTLGIEPTDPTWVRYRRLTPQGPQE